VNGRKLPPLKSLRTFGPSAADDVACFERDGLVTSAVASDDRRNLLASLTPKGEAIVEKALQTSKARLRSAFTALSSDELTTLTTLLQRVSEGFAVSADATEGQDESRDSKSRRASRWERGTASGGK
jgi:hypothetical protein